ncbi:hypothetical protein VCR1J2_410046 [Vibrio coralliirubri]|nr:hypothetical protein VCR1J2_410046 [Vibrio coralliirubri]CDT97769.1 hypothetical protein VCR8J2_560022 [Vibrio coralliirubri]
MCVGGISCVVHAVRPIAIKVNSAAFFMLFVAQMDRFIIRGFLTYTRIAINLTSNINSNYVNRKVIKRLRNR